MLVIYPFTLQRQINFSHYAKHIYTGESILNHLSSHFIANIACKKELKLIFNLVQEETRGTVCQVCRWSPRASRGVSSQKGAGLAGWWAVPAAGGGGERVGVAAPPPGARPAPAARLLPSLGAAQESGARGRGLGIASVPRPPSPLPGCGDRRDVPGSGGGWQDRVCGQFRGPSTGRDSLRAVPSGTVRGEGRAAAVEPRDPAPTELGSPFLHLGTHKCCSFRGWVASLSPPPLQPPGGPRPPSPALQPASPLVRAPRASAGPGWAAGTQYNPVPVLMG